MASAVEVLASGHTDKRYQPSKYRHTKPVLNSTDLNEAVTAPLVAALFKKTGSKKSSRGLRLLENSWPGAFFCVWFVILGGVFLWFGYFFGWLLVLYAVANPLENLERFMLFF